MRFKRYILPAAPLAVLALAFVAAPETLAQYGLQEAAGKLIPTTDLTSIIGRILKTLLGFVGTLFLVLMVYAGFLYMTARGDSKKVDSAKQMIISAIIGVVIIAGAYAITSFVLTAATGAGGGGSSDSSSNPTPVTGTGSQGDNCQQKTCRQGTDCTNPPDACYTGTCLCFGEGDPATGGSTPCTFGFCGLVNP